MGIHPSSLPVTDGAIPPAKARRSAITWKLFFIGVLVILLQVPLFMINSLQQERRQNNTPPDLKGSEVAKLRATDARPELAPYRMVERSLKYGALVLSLIFAAFFLFETLCAVRLHAVHYGLVGAAMCLFYLALLALGEVVSPGVAYVGAAVASSLLITLYSASILRSRARALVIAALLAAVHGVLYIVLRMESYALLAGTGALFVALGAIMFFTRNVDWHAQDAGPVARVS